MPIPTNTCTYEYIQIHAIRTNTYQYMQYVPLPIRTSIRAKLIHTNTYQNTCQNTYPYIPIHVHWFNTCQYVHCTSLMMAQPLPCTWHTGYSTTCQLTVQSPQATTLDRHAACMDSIKIMIDVAVSMDLNRKSRTSVVLLLHTLHL